MKSRTSKLLFPLVIASFLLSAILLTQLQFKPAILGKTTAHVGICIGYKPVLEPVGNLTAIVNEEFYYRVNSSSNNDPVIYSANSTIFTINETTGVINFTHSQVHAEWVRISVNNSRCNDLWDFEDVNLTVHIYNTAPVLEKIEDFNLTEDEPFYYDVNATDAQNDTLTFSDNTTMFDINETTGEISFTPLNEHVGVHWVTIRVTDEWGLYDEQSVNVNVTNVNDAPILETIPNYTTESGNPLYEDQTFYAQINASDPDGDTLEYLDNTSLFTINSETGVILYTPDYYHVGNHSAEIYVVDGQAMASQVFLMEILEVNDPPVLHPIGAQTAYVNRTFFYDVNATDEEDGSDTEPGNENLTFSSDTNLFTINPKNGTIEFTPADSDNGTYSINISVNDTQGLTSSELVSFSVVVLNRPPRITSYSPAEAELTIYVGDSQEFSITKEDPDGTTPSVYWYVDSGLAAFDSDSYVFNSTAVVNVTVRVVVSDGEYEDSHNWSVQVIPRPPSPPGVGAGGGGRGGGVACTELWVCGDWSECMINNIQVRHCEDKNRCGTTYYKPKTQRLCTYTPLPTCHDGILNQNEILVDCGGVCDPCPSCTDRKCNQGELCQICSGDECPRDAQGKVIPDCGGPCPPCIFPPREIPKQPPRIRYSREILLLIIPLLVLILLILARHRIRKLIASLIGGYEEDDSRKVARITELLRKADSSLEENDVAKLKRITSEITKTYNSIRSAKKKRQIYPKLKALIDKIKMKFR